MLGISIDKNVHKKCVMSGNAWDLSGMLPNGESKHFACKN